MKEKCSISTKYEKNETNILNSDFCCTVSTSNTVKNQIKLTQTNVLAFKYLVNYRS